MSRGRIILTNAVNTYTGATSAFNSGTLQIGTAASGGSIGATSAVDVDTGDGVVDRQYRRPDGQHPRQ